MVPTTDPPLFRKTHKYIAFVHGTLSDITLDLLGIVKAALLKQKVVSPFAVVNPVPTVVLKPKRAIGAFSIHIVFESSF